MATLSAPPAVPIWAMHLIIPTAVPSRPNSGQITAMVAMP